MKKHDEGYVMLLVVVVILVLSIVSASLMSITVANLKNQRNSVKRMQEKYSAQGALEKEIAKIQSSIPEKETVEIAIINQQSADSMQEAVKNWITSKIDPEIKTENLSLPDETGAFHYKILRSAETEEMQISCELKLTGKATLDETDPDLLPLEDGNMDAIRDGKIKCEIEFQSLTYTSYEITEKEVAE